MASTDLNSNLIHLDYEKIVRGIIQFLGNSGNVDNACKLQGKSLLEIKDLIKTEVLNEVTVNTTPPVITVTPPTVTVPGGTTTVAITNVTDVTNVTEVTNISNTDIYNVADLKVFTRVGIPIEDIGGDYTVTIKDNIKDIVGVFLAEDANSDNINRQLLVDYDVILTYDSALGFNTTTLKLNDSPTLFYNEQGQLRKVIVIFIYEALTSYTLGGPIITPAYSGDGIHQQNNSAIAFNPPRRANPTLQYISAEENANSYSLDSQIVIDPTFNWIINNIFSNPALESEFNILLENELRYLINEINSNDFNIYSELNTSFSENVNRIIHEIKSNDVKVENLIELGQSLARVINQFGGQSKLPDSNSEVASTIFHLILYKAIKTFKYDTTLSTKYLIEISHLIRNVVNNYIPLMVDNLNKYNNSTYSQHYIILMKNIKINFPHFQTELLRYISYIILQYDNNEVFWEHNDYENSYTNTYIIQERNLNILMGILMTHKSIAEKMTFIIQQRGFLNMTYTPLQNNGMVHNYITCERNYNSPDVLPLIDIGLNNFIMKQVVYRPVLFKLNQYDLGTNPDDFYLAENFDRWGYYNRALGLAQVYSLNRDILCEEGQTHFQVEYDARTIDIMLEGMLLRRNVDYTALNNTDIYLMMPAKQNDTLQIRSYVSFESFDSYTKNETLQLIQSQKLATPILRGENEVYENTVIELNILNFDNECTYHVIVNDAIVNPANIQIYNDQIHILLPTLNGGKVATINVYASKEGFWNSMIASHVLIIKDFYSEADLDMLFTSAQFGRSSLFSLNNMEVKDSRVEQTNAALPGVLESKLFSQDEVKDWTSFQFTTETENIELTLIDSAYNEYNRIIVSSKDSLLVNTKDLPVTLYSGLKLLVYEDDLQINMLANEIEIIVKPIFIENIIFSEEESNIKNGFQYAKIDLTGYQFKNKILRAWVATDSIQVAFDQESKANFEETPIPLEPHDVSHEFKVSLTDSLALFTKQDFINTELKFNNQFYETREVTSAKEYYGLITSNVLLSNDNDLINKFLGAKIFERSGYIYIIGGYVNGMENRSIYRYNLKYNNITKLTDIPDSRVDYAVTMIGTTTENKVYDIRNSSTASDLIYIHGGMLLGNNLLRSDLLQYNVDLNLWTTLNVNEVDDPGQHYWCQHQIEAVGEKLYIFGGYLLPLQYKARNDIIIQVRDNYRRFPCNDYHINPGKLRDQYKFNRTTDGYPIYNLINDGTNTITKLELNIFEADATIDRIELDVWEENLVDFSYLPVTETIIYDQTGNEIRYSRPPTRRLTIQDSEFHIANKVIFNHDFGDANIMHFTPTDRNPSPDYAEWSHGWWDPTNAFYQINSDNHFGTTQGYIELDYKLIAGERYEFTFTYGGNTENSGTATNVKFGNQSINLPTAWKRVEYWDGNSWEWTSVQNWYLSKTVNVKITETCDRIYFTGGNNFRIYKITIKDQQVWLYPQTNMKFVAYKLYNVLTGADPKVIEWEHTQLTDRMLQYDIPSGTFEEKSQLPYVITQCGTVSYENSIMIWSGRLGNPTLKFDKNLTKKVSPYLIRYDCAQNHSELVFTTSNIEYDNIHDESEPLPSLFPIIGTVGNLLYIWDGFIPNNFDIDTGYTFNNKIFLGPFYAPRNKWKIYDMTNKCYSPIIFSDPSQEGRDLIIANGTKLESIPDELLDNDNPNELEIVRTMLTNHKSYEGVNKRIQIYKKLIYFKLKDFPWHVDTTQLSTLILKSRMIRPFQWTYLFKENKSVGTKYFITSYAKIGKFGEEIIFRWLASAKEKLKSVFISFTKDKF